VADEQKQPAKKVGKYEIIEELGRGAMGVVYKARDPFIGRLVALKTISPGLLDNPELLKRFYREAQAAGGLQHPNIVIIYDLGEADGLPYIAMEFLEGEPLEKVISRQPLMPLAQKLNICMQLARGLDYAHKRGLVHRDIKPGNIIVVKDGTVKVVDFGIVRLTDSGPGGGTKTGMVIGTVGYMSPEQIHGEHVDARSDLFSVGVVMYELFSYKKPFTGKNLTQVLLNIINEDPEPLADVAPQVPPHLAEIVHKALNKDPEERFQSLEEMVLELEPVARSLQKDMVDELVKQGQDLVGKKEFTQAREVLRNALMIDTTHNAAKTLMAQVTNELRRVETYPKIQESLAAGEAALQDGKLEEAVEKLEEVLRLDSQHGQAQELLESARQQLNKLTQAKKSLEASKRAFNAGNLTIAESELQKVFEVDAQNAEAQALLGKIEQERVAKDKRARLHETLRQGRQLLIQQRYDDCVKLLEEVEKEHAGEAELASLLQSARSATTDQQRAQIVGGKMEEARNLFRQLEHTQALTVLDDLLKNYPDEPAAKQLRELVLKEQQEADKEKRLEGELAGLRQIIEQKDFATAVQKAEKLQKDFPDDTEVGRLLSFARAEHMTSTQMQKAVPVVQSLQSLLAAGKFEQAQREADKALKKFPDHPELKQLLEDAQKKRKDRAKRADLERRIRAMKVSIERGDLTEAIDLGKQAIQEFPKDTDISQLLSFAEKEYESRDKKRKRDDQLKDVVAQMEKQDFDGATMMLQSIEKEFPFDPTVKELKKAAERHEVPAAAATMIGGPMLSELQAASAENVYITAEGQPVPPSAATPAAPGAGKQPEMKAASAATPGVTPGAPPPKIVPSKPEAKPAAGAPAPGVGAPPPVRPTVEAPPAVRPVPARPPVAPPMPPPVVEVPFWKKPVGIAVIGAVLLAAGVGVYFGFLAGPPPPTELELAVQTEAEDLIKQGRIEEGLAKWKQLQTTASLRAKATDEIDRLTKLRAEEDKLMTEAQAALAQKRYTDAQGLYRQVVDLGGTQKDEAEQALKTVQSLAAGGDPSKLERDYFQQAQNEFSAKRYERARTLYQQVISLKIPSSTFARQAQDQIKKADTLIAEQRAFGDAQNLFNNKQYDQAKPKFEEVVRMGGEFRDEAQGRLKQIETFQKDAAAATAAVAKLDSEKRAFDGLVGRFNTARQANDESSLRQLQGDFRKVVDERGSQAVNARDYADLRIPSELTRIQRESADQADRQAYQGLLGRFNTAKQGNDASALRSLQGDFRTHAGRGGATAGDARDIAETQIPKELDRIAAAAKPPEPTPTPAQPTPTQPAATTTTTTQGPRVSLQLSATRQRWTGALGQGQLVGESFIDGGLQPIGQPTLPEAVAQRGAARSSVRVLITIEQDGKVSGGRVLQDNGAGAAVIEAAKAWRFQPPTVNGKPVKTSVMAVIEF